MYVQPPLHGVRVAPFFFDNLETRLVAKEQYDHYRADAGSTRYFLVAKRIWHTLSTHRRSLGATSRTTANLAQELLVAFECTSSVDD